jgi:peroxiredoxin Q/BCP
LAGSAYACAGGPVKRADGGEGLLPVGAPAPAMSGKDERGKVVTLADYRGTPVVVYFYPKDETPGCTKEACAFRDNYQAFETKGVHILGVSQDTEEIHRQFRTKFKLPFALVADVDGSITRAYGVRSTLGMSSRVTFLVDGEGRVAKVWPDVDPVVHATEVLAAAAELQPAKPPPSAPVSP